MRVSASPAAMVSPAPTSSRHAHYGMHWGEGAARCFSIEGDFLDEDQDVRLMPVPDSFMCPISAGIMVDPVATVDGCAYERDSIERWFRERRQHGQQITSPITGLELPSATLMPLLALQRAIEVYLKNRPELKLAHMAGRSFEEAAQLLQTDLFEKQTMHATMQDEVKRLRQANRTLRRLLREADATLHGNNLRSDTASSANKPGVETAIATLTNVTSVSTSNNTSANCERWCPQTESSGTSTAVAAAAAVTAAAAAAAQAAGHTPVLRSSSRAAKKRNTGDVVVEAWHRKDVAALFLVAVIVVCAVLQTVLIHRHPPHGDILPSATTAQQPLAAAFGGAFRSLAAFGSEIKGTISGAFIGAFRVVAASSSSVASRDFGDLATSSFNASIAGADHGGSSRATVLVSSGWVASAMHGAEHDGDGRQRSPASSATTTTSDSAAMTTASFTPDASLLHGRNAGTDSFRSDGKPDADIEEEFRGDGDVHKGGDQALLTHSRQDVSTFAMLVEQLSSENVNERQLAALTLRHNAADRTENQNAIVQAGAVPPLVKMLKGGDAGCREQATRALWTLVRSSKDINSYNQRVIAQSDAIESLILLLDDAVSNIRVVAAAVLNDLAMDNPTNQDAIASAGAIVPLIKLLQHDDGPSLVMASGLMQRLGTHNNNPRVSAALFQAVEPLVELLRTGSVLAQEEAALTLGKFAANGEQIHSEIIRAGAVQVLVDLLRSDMMQGTAALVLQNLAERGGVETRDSILQSGAIEELLHLLESDIPTVREKAGRALLTLAKEHGDIQTLIMDAEGVVALAEIVRSES
eukprot:TRINITY_DN48431_c0_g1_i1.p1 TRINITY_DN48431_c0_g1~~TRINITY_DN48431_c0_g1_i1.p1  ORF type:complete len:811 (-),score=142.23 TRINITY_DN48431_c0_g1_i1:208-2640(-)